MKMMRQVKFMLKSLRDFHFNKFLIDPNWLIRQNMKQAMQSCKNHDREMQIICWCIWFRKYVRFK